MAGDHVGPAGGAHVSEPSLGYPDAIKRYRPKAKTVRTSRRGSELLTYCSLLLIRVPLKGGRRVINLIAAPGIGAFTFESPRSSFLIAAALSIQPTEDQGECPNERVSYRRRAAREVES